MSSEVLAASTVSRQAGSMNRAVFFDRDGTLIRDREYLDDPDEIRWFPGILEGLKRLRDNGFLLVVVTNQSGVARGYFGEARVRTVHRELSRQAAQSGVWFDGIYYCPQHPEAVEPRYRQPLDCRKPRPGMLLTAQEDHRIDLQRSYLVGDKASDIEAARRVGVRPLLVMTGKGSDQRTRVDLKKDWIVPDASAAVERILATEGFPPETAS